MEHSIALKDGATVLSIRGDVDLESSPEARKVLLECVDLKKTLLVDMSGVD